MKQIKYNSNTRSFSESVVNFGKFNTFGKTPKKGKKRVKSDSDLNYYAVIGIIECDNGDLEFYDAALYAKSKTCAVEQASRLLSYGKLRKARAFLIPESTGYVEDSYYDYERYIIADISDKMNQKYPNYGKSAKH